MTSPIPARLFYVVESAADSVTDDRGHWWHKDVVATVHASALNGGLTKAELAVLLELGAKYLVDNYTDRRNPKRRKGTSYYHPRNAMKLGKGERLWMKNATPADIPPWLFQDSKNAHNVAEASAEKQSYGKDRMKSFRLYGEYNTLDELERGVYGYSDEPDPLTGNEPDEE